VWVFHDVCVFLWVVCYGVLCDPVCMVCYGRVKKFKKVLVVSGVSCCRGLFTVLRKFYAIIGKFCAYYTHTSRHKRKRHTHLKLADYHIFLSINRHVSCAPLYVFCMRLEATALYSVHWARSRIICALCSPVHTVPYCADSRG
jgi:hypothetical protein